MAPHEHYHYTDCERIALRLNCKPLFRPQIALIKRIKLCTNIAITLIVKGFHRDLTNNGFRRITLIALIIIREIRLISFNPLFEKNPVNLRNLWSLLRSV